MSLFTKIPSETRVPVSWKISNNTAHQEVRPLKNGIGVIFSWVRGILIG